MDFRGVLRGKHTESLDTTMSDSLPELSPGGHPRSPGALSSGEQTVVESKKTESFTSKRMSSSTEV